MNVPTIRLMKAALLRAVICVASAPAMLCAVGCGTDSQIGPCYTPALKTSASGSPDFSLVTASDFTLYPGQTTTMPVEIDPVNGSKGTVTLSGIHLPQGISVTPMSAPIGSTALLQVTASPDVVSSCFNGISQVYDAGVAFTVNASSSSGSIASDVATTVVLGNPAYTPATASGLPVLSINTTASEAVTSEDDYVTAAMTIQDPSNAGNAYSGTLGIKGHGNSTWLMPKKPYRLNLDKKASLLGMASDSNWILLANFDDKTLLRNDVALETSRRFGMAWTPSSVFVELYVNGQYQGNYELTEKVEVSKARLNIGSMDDTDISGTNLTGGYLAEIDHYEDETFTLTSQVGLPIGIYDPETPAPQQSAYFTTVFNAAESSMYAGNYTDPTLGWRASWDENSVIDWFLVEELAGNQDADDFSSDYFYKPRGDNRFYRGPVWDMDITFGNDNISAIVSPTYPWVRQTSLWYRRLFTDPSFQADVKARWAVVRPQAITLSDYINSEAARLQASQAANFQRWPILQEKVWPNPEAAGSYTGEVAYMQSWLAKRIAYMDATYGQ